MKIGKKRKQKKKIVGKPYFQELTFRNSKLKRRLMNYNKGNKKLLQWKKSSNQKQQKLPSN